MNTSPNLRDKEKKNYKFFRVHTVGITGRIAALLFFVCIIPMFATGILIENGNLLPGKNVYLAIPIVLIFILIPISRFLAQYTINKDLATINKFCNQIKKGNYNVSFTLPNQKENEDELVSLLRNLDWMSHNLTYRDKHNKKLITETRQSLENMEKMAFTDPLTGLYNRRYLNYVDELFFTPSPQMNSNTHASLIYIDCDKFKQINDTRGHIYGDHLLVGLAECLTKVCKRELDIPFRLGGDEFAVFLPETTAQQATSLGEKIKEMYHGLDVSKGTSLSIGIAMISHQETEDLHQLIDYADKQAYIAKRSGGGRIAVM